MTKADIVERIMTNTGFSKMESFDMFEIGVLYNEEHP